MSPIIPVADLFHAPGLFFIHLSSLFYECFISLSLVGSGPRGAGARLAGLNLGWMFAWIEKGSRYRKKCQFYELFGTAPDLPRARMVPARALGQNASQLLGVGGGYALDLELMWTP